MFDIDYRGLAELEGGKPPHRLAFEPIANVFDEFRIGQLGDRRAPTMCRVNVEHSANPRGVWLTVCDNGAGFENEADIWTLFGTTRKRSEPGVAGRFNAGDKQLIACSRIARVCTGQLEVTFADGVRSTKRRQMTPEWVEGVTFAVLMPWSKAEADEVANQLRAVLPPVGLEYVVNGDRIESPTPLTVNVKLPTVVLSEGVMISTVRRSAVDVLPPATPDAATLYELGIPVCSLTELGFPWSLNVLQKVPVPMSRDTVSPNYLGRLIGTVVEAAAMDGHILLSGDEQGAGFVRTALEWIREPGALKSAVDQLYGETAVRVSSDPISNAQAAACGAALIPGRYFTPATRRRLDEARALPTASTVYAGAAALAEDAKGWESFPTCGGSGRRAKQSG